MKLTDLREIFNIIGDEDEGFNHFLNYINQALALFNTNNAMDVPLFPDDLDEATAVLYDHPIEDRNFWRSVALPWAHVWLNRYIYKDAALAASYEVDARNSTDRYLTGNDGFKTQYRNENATKVLYRRDYAKRIDTSTYGAGVIGVKGAYENLKYSDTIGAGAVDKLRTIFDFTVTVEKIADSTQSEVRVRIKTLSTNEARVLPLSVSKTDDEDLFVKEVNKTLPDVRYTLEETLTATVTTVLEEYTYVSNSLTEDEVEQIENTQEAWRCFEALFDKDILGI